MSKRKPNKCLGSEELDNHLFGKDMKKTKKRIELYQRYENAIKAYISYEGNNYIRTFMELFIQIMEDETTSNNIEKLHKVYDMFKRHIKYTNMDIEYWNHHYIWPGIQSEEHPLGSEGHIEKTRLNEKLIENKIGYIFYLCLKLSLQLLIMLNDDSFEIVRPLILYRGERCDDPSSTHSFFQNHMKESFTSTALLDDLHSAGMFGYATHAVGLKIYVGTGRKILPTFYFSGKKNLLNDVEPDEIILKPGSFLEKKEYRNATSAEFSNANSSVKLVDDVELENLYVHEYYYCDDSFDGTTIPLFVSKLFEELFLDTKFPFGFYQHVIETENSYNPRENEAQLKCLIQDCSELIKKLRESYKY